MVKENYEYRSSSSLFFKVPIEFLEKEDLTNVHSLPKKIICRHIGLKVGLMWMLSTYLAEFQVVTDSRNGATIYHSVLFFGKNVKNR